MTTVLVRPLARYAPVWPLLSWTLFALGSGYCIGQLLGVLSGYDNASGPLGIMSDANAYYSADVADPYRNATVGARDAYLYSPAFLQVLAPLWALPAGVFIALWTALHLVAIAWLAPWMAIFPGVMDDVIRGNVNTFLAVSLVLAVSGRSWAWAALLLTKVTPGVGMLYHVAHREWRALGVALGVTMVIVALSLLLGPQHWAAWVESLQANTSVNVPLMQVPGPLWLRVGIGAALCLTGRAWLLPVGVLLAMPNAGLSSFALLAAIPRLTRKAA